MELPLQTKGKSDQEASTGMAIPGLEEVLGAAYDVPPEFGDRAEPETVLLVTHQGWEAVISGCVEADPQPINTVSVNMQFPITSMGAVILVGRWCKK